MSNAALFEVCLHNLQRQLENVLKTPGIETRKSAELALALVGELQELHKAAVEDFSVNREPEFRSSNDITNYKMYELLATFGLSQSQLLAVAKAEGLHELRKLRMLRAVYGLALAEARIVLAKSTEDI